jgi:hypothetical protein
MPAALQSLALGTALALGPAAEQPLDVTLVATEEQADRVAQLLAPRLTEAGFRAEFRRCDDFGCVTAPVPGEGPEVIVVVSAQADDTLVIVTSDAPTGMVVVVDEVPVAMPHTVLDGEALGFAVLRAFGEPLPERRTEWSAAMREGLDRAPPPEVAETTTVPPNPALALGRGPYLELASGSSSALEEGMALGIAAAIGGGYLFAARRAPRFRAALGVHAATHNKLGPNGTGLFFAAARFGLGAATPRVLAMGHLGVGPAFIYEGRFGGASPPQGVVTLAGSLRGRVSERVALGVEAGALVGLPYVSPHLYGLFNATFIWDAPRRKESGR